MRNKPRKRVYNVLYTFRHFSRFFYGSCVNLNVVGYNEKGKHNSGVKLDLCNSEKVPNRCVIYKAPMKFYIHLNT